MSDKILKRKEAVEKSGLSYPTIWRLERRGQFPARLRLSQGRVGWLESEITQWLAARIRIKRAD